MQEGVRLSGSAPSPQLLEAQNAHDGGKSVLRPALPSPPEVPSHRRAQVTQTASFCPEQVRLWVSRRACVRCGAPRCDRAGPPSLGPGLLTCGEDRGTPEDCIGGVGEVPQVATAP